MAKTAEHADVAAGAAANFQNLGLGRQSQLAEHAGEHGAAAGEPPVALLEGADTVIDCAFHGATMPNKGYPPANQQGKRGVHAVFTAWVADWRG
jgi:hypothetical protein